MNNDQVKKQVIHRLAEDKVPSVINSWQTIQSRINDHKEHKTMQLRWVSVSSTVFVAVALVVFFLTPIGKSVAQGLLNYFTKPGGDEQRIQFANEIENPGIETQTDAIPSKIIDLDGFVRGLTLEEAETLAGFVVSVPKVIPQDYQLKDVIYDPEIQGVTQQYFFEGNYGKEFMTLTQQISSEVEAIGSSAEVYNLQVGDILVESVPGYWFSYTGETVETWQPDSPVHTYRWSMGEFFYRLQFVYNEPASPGYVDETSQLSIVESLISH